MGKRPNLAVCPHRMFAQGLTCPVRDSQEGVKNGKLHNGQQNNGQQNHKGKDWGSGKSQLSVGARSSPVD
ncbi:MAG: hypothetical protein AAF892_07745 [Cyanobacteria bacterium P01_D01_bin.71]